MNADRFSLPCALHPENMAGMKTVFRIAAVATCILVAGALRAQTASQASASNPMANMPSEAEIGELTAKAAEKLEAFQKTLDIYLVDAENAYQGLYANDGVPMDVEACRSFLAAKFDFSWDIIWNR
jgi:hypothetical protein